MELSTTTSGRMRDVLRLSYSGITVIIARLARTARAIAALCFTAEVATTNDDPITTTAHDDAITGADLIAHRLRIQATSELGGGAVIPTRHASPSIVGAAADSISFLWTKSDGMDHTTELFSVLPRTTSGAS